ncbi:MAG: hypothetical protein ACOYMK_12600, partial [Hyphomonadaceae bacterium]
VAKWCEFMSAPTASGPFAALDDLKETLAPLFQDDLALFFLPWAAENLESSLAGAETFTVTLGKEAVTLTPLRSAARSFRELRRKFVAGQAIDTLKAFTDDTTTTIFLLRPQRVDIRPAPAAAPVADGEDAARVAGADTSAQEDAAPESGESRPRRRRRRGGKGAAAGASVSTDQVEAVQEEAPIAFAEEGVGVETPVVETPVVEPPVVEPPVVEPQVVEPPAEGDALPAERPADEP